MGIYQCSCHQRRCTSRRRKLFCKGSMSNPGVATSVSVFLPLLASRPYMSLTGANGCWSLAGEAVGGGASWACRARCVSADGVCVCRAGFMRTFSSPIGPGLSVMGLGPGTGAVRAARTLASRASRRVVSIGACCKRRIEASSDQTSRGASKCHAFVGKPTTGPHLCTTQS